jgi:hypothetical protein
LERALRFYRDGLGLPTPGIIGTEFEHGAVVFIQLQAGVNLALWTRYLRMTRLERGNTFSVSDLPPGRYLAIAVADHESGEETNPELLQRFRPAATPFTLEEGEARVLNLSVAVQ